VGARKKKKDVEDLIKNKSRLKNCGEKVGALFEGSTIINTYKEDV
jgi:hypothetical protein